MWKRNFRSIAVLCSPFSVVVRDWYQPSGVKSDIFLLENGREWRKLTAYPVSAVIWSTSRWRSRLCDVLLAWGERCETSCSHFSQKSARFAVRARKLTFYPNRLKWDEFCFIKTEFIHLAMSRLTGERYVKSFVCCAFSVRWDVRRLISPDSTHLGSVSNSIWNDAHFCA